MFFLFLRFPLPGYSMPMGITLSSALPLFLPDQRRVNLLVIPKSSLADLPVLDRVKCKD